jgi:hypothetical protein
VNAAEVFVELLHARLVLGQHDLKALREQSYPCDPLFEAGADLADAVLAYEDGRGGANLVRELALKCAQLSAQVWLVSTGGVPLETEGEDVRSDG